ncbi:MAG: DMT family transporter [Eubacterium sp.]|nr:DMT family transporter [Eubacterium sp.]
MRQNSRAVTLRHSLLLVLTALIWGVAFVAQREGGDATGPYTFCCLRYLIGGAVLLPTVKWMDRAGFTNNKPVTRADKKQLLAGGVCCGLCLSGGSLLQQVGIYQGTAPGKAGFLTACYIVLVPILGIFLKRRCGWNVWVATVITVAGLYLLCMHGSLTVKRSDVLVLLCSVMYSLHILTIDHFINKKTDGVRMSCIQFFVAAAVCMFPMFFLELHGSVAALPQALAVAFGREALLPLLFAGVMSSGIAYTLQIIGQQAVNPTVASLLMSLESVFSVLAGWLLLGQTLSGREIGGCVLIFLAVVLAQLLFSKEGAKPTSQNG